MPDAVHIAASGIVYNGKGGVLLENRADNGWWGLPGGHVDVGESVEQAAIREILEETGIRTRVKRLVGIYSDPKFNVIGAYSDGLIHFVVMIFECEYLSGDLEVSNESADVRYFPVRNLPAKTLLCDVQAITDALENRIQPFIR
ncbi:MAG: NUDIX domain-containing protein [Chloroflexi bacterium]|nr:NUDIX domain-containing protein [Chloroflexota bacterium]